MSGWGGRLVAVVGMMVAVVVTPAVGNSYVGVGDARSFWLHLNGTPTPEWMLAAEARRHAYIVLNAWEHDIGRRIKRYNPDVQLFVYKDLSSTRSYACRGGVDDKHLPAGVGYCAADRDHPEWFLLDGKGKRLEYDGYPGHWQMDVGNPAYQNTWADNVIADAKAGGFDGVFMDNALFPCDAYHPGVCPKKYPTDTAIQTAYKAMLANTRPKFTEAKLKTVANMSNARLHDGAWEVYTEHLDGGFDEWWIAFSNDNLLPDYDQGWSRQVAEIAANERRGKLTWVQPHFSPNRTQPLRYAMASYFLVVGDKAAIAEMEKTDDYGDPTARDPMYHWDLGKAEKPYREIAPKLFQRDFTCGTVIVNANPTGSPAVRVELAEPYADERNVPVTSVSLPGTSGTVLRKSC
ncbi:MULTISPECIES: putative glycoside hydrolase [unclassified Saccharothrix]|uniref:putative glycoside hydrolase n=1 Tax=unclassified Saccharothrix TaxID=2593673 RepID=UPI00307EF7F9